MRLSRRHSVAPTGWFQSTASEGDGLWGTHFLTVGCPDDFAAVRVGFANIDPVPYTIPRIVVCPSTTWNDYANPTGDGTPSVLTTAHDGIDDNSIVTDPSAPQRLVVRPPAPDRAAGEPALPAWSWTDWCAVRSLGADPATGMRVLMIRHTVARNGGAPVTFVNGTLRDWRANALLNGGYDYFCGGLKNGTDRTDFSPVNAISLPVNMMVNGSFVAAVQFLTRRAGAVGMTTGDSHHQGTTTCGAFNNYLAQATVSLRRSRPGAVPLGWVNCAIGGATSSQFFPYLDRLLGAVAPSYVVLPGWTANDPGPTGLADAVATDRFYARLLAAAEQVRRADAVPIWLTPFPRDAAFMDAVRLSAWNRMRETILSLRRAGERVIDATPVLTCRDGDRFTGTYLPGTSDDGVHPNDHGHALVADLLASVVADLLPATDASA